MLAQLEATVDDPDNVCCRCGEEIAGPSAEVVIFTDGEMTLIKLADSRCMRSAVRPVPKLRRDVEAGAGDGFDMLTLLGRRDTDPRALLFLEPTVIVAGPGEDPLEIYSLALGLSPISGSIKDVLAPLTDAFTIERTEAGLALRLGELSEQVNAREIQREEWIEVADGRALVIVARGLGLARAEPTIEEALMLRPAWGAIAAVSA